MHAPPDNERGAAAATATPQMLDSSQTTTARNITDETIIAKVVKNSRVFVDGKDGEPVATKKGLAIAPDKIPELMAALEKAAA